MLICSGSSGSTGGSALLYVTDRLEVKADGTIDMGWEYKGPVFEMQDQPVTYGTSWELPILMPLQNKAGIITKYAFFISPAPAGIADNKVYYWVGDFDRERGQFTPDESMGNLPRILDYGSNVFTGPSVLADPVTGRVCMFSIMQDQRTGPEEGAAGWAHCVGLTRNIFLNDEGTDVCVEPDPRLYGLLGEELVSLKDADIGKANETLSLIGGDMLYIKAVIAPQGSRNFGLTCKAEGRRNQTTFTYYRDKGSIDGFTGNRGKAAPVSVINDPLPLKDGVLTMEIIIDRSLTEAFFNGDKAMNIGTGVIIDICDRMRPLKIRNELVLKDWTEAVIVPETCRQAVEPYVPEELKLKTHYLRNKCKDIWEWSEQVYEYVRDTVGK